MKSVPLIFLGLAFASGAHAQAPRPTPAPSTQTPPPGIPVPESDRRFLEHSLSSLFSKIHTLKSKQAHADLLPDLEIFHKAVHDALVYDEIFDLKQIPAAKTLLEEGHKRADALILGQAPWTTAAGLVVRGFRSRVDGSIQPYGMVIPEGWTEKRSTRGMPLYSWCHGRGNTLSELAFLADRMKKPGEFTPPEALVVHVYGRFCNATKFAGETDFFEAAESVRTRYPVDPDRWIVAGFSMGGASTWHLAAHHAGLFAGASPGAGFAETAIYARVFDPEKTPPPWWEQLLWRQYDATASAGNLFNLPLVAYSGEEDGQIQSAHIMAEAMTAEGLTLEHLVGPKTGHKYEPETKKRLDARLRDLALKGRDPFPREVRFTTYTLRYHQMEWLTLDSLEKHWERAHVNAQLPGGNHVTFQTRNVAALTFGFPHQLPSPFDGAPTLEVDGQQLEAPWPASGKSGWSAQLQKRNGKWTLITEPSAPATLAKVHGLTGPIDDAFMDPFIFVKPTGKSPHPKVGSWVESEMQRAFPQWRTVFRGEPPVKNDTEISEEDIASRNLVLWGDPSSNSVIRKILPQLPFRWTEAVLSMGHLSVSAAEHVPVLIFPNPLNPKHYVVLNSSFTFREGSSVTNSQQTPKLPDWALINLAIPPSNLAPGLIVDAGFFNENWQLQ
jgi:hypothetical protein